MKAVSALALAALAALSATPSLAAEKPEKKKDVLSGETFKGLEFRSIGPSMTSGRVIDIAVVESRPSTYYVAAASGGVWKTTNGGTTFTPIFDDQGTYSVGCVAIDPKRPLVVWVGSGENNSQRSVSYGDGVYKSVDGGKTWKNMGLKTSEHIGKIVIHPEKPDTVYVASQGPLWKEGGERGLYKTTDGGGTWKSVLTISENTGVSDLWMDPRDADVLYATAYQRRRHVFTLINGGPESGIHKSTDGGTSWRKLDKGLPKADLGRIGLAVSPARPDTVYAIVEAKDEKDRGSYRSTDAGGSWERVGDHVSTSPQYYQELVPDPLDADRVYSMDTFMQVTEDGGKTWKKVPEKYKHVDNHALVIDKSNTDHLLAGCDGGLYESWDRGQTWQYKPNLPLTQFYKVEVDNATPIYNVYGGTQDNNTLGGPSRTFTSHGITNADWFRIVGGDGFQPRVDPDDPNIVYGQAQHGVLARYDRKTGEPTLIQPQQGKGDDPLRWNWDSPLIISPHSGKRLYFAAQRVFRSDDRGDSWRPISGDLTAGIDRNKLKVMGRVFGPDAVAKNSSTSLYGNIVSLTESPKVEGLLYVGTDDGLVQISEDGGGAWRKVAKVGTVPDQTYVSDLETSVHNADRVFAAFDDHKRGNFKPYLYRSDDRGKTWTSISGDLPERGTVYCVVEDHVRPELLFAGTEWGVYFTIDGGAKWMKLEGGLPVIQVRDIAIQRRENDLVLATFGRGFYILDDYSPLRKVTREVLEGESALFPVKAAGIYEPATLLDLREKGQQGDSYYTASNPPVGAVFTTYLKEDLKTKKKARQEDEKRKFEKGEDVSYPSWEALQAEQREEEPAVLLTVTDESGQVVRRLEQPGKAGFKRVAWDLRFPPPNPTELSKKDRSPFEDEPRGPLVVPGTYKVTAAKRVDGKLTPIGEAQSFSVAPSRAAVLTPEERTKTLAFQQKTARLQRAVLGAVEAAKEGKTRVDHLLVALREAPGADAKLRDEARAIGLRLADISEELSGRGVKERYNEPAPPSISSRVNTVVEAHWGTTGAGTKTYVESYDVAAEQFAALLPRLTTLLETDLRGLETRAEAAGAPWTPGRVPRWTKE